MAIKYLGRTTLAGPLTSSGALYTEKIILEAGESDVFILPLTQIYAMTFLIEGTGTVHFSNDSIADLVADNADFVEWDGVSEINPGITAFKVVWGSGTVTVKAAVKTVTQ